jgi:transcriptional regulator with XRE-family HTH domain
MARAEHQARVAAQEIKVARLSHALTLRDASRRSGVVVSTIERIEAGDPGVQLNTLVAVADAVGLDVVVKLYPSAGPRLRDSEQLHIAEALAKIAHPRWQPALEVPAGDHGEAADLVLYGPDEVLHVEIDRKRLDHQAQHRRDAAKRRYLEMGEARPVRLVLVVVDTPANREAMQPHLELVRLQFPAGSREVLHALRNGRPLGRDGLLWVRPRLYRSIGTKDASGSLEARHVASIGTPEA